MHSIRKQNNEVMQILFGVLLVLFVAMMSINIVATAMPTIMGKLHGTEAQYTWVVTASLLSSTVATPIMGKMADMYDSKKLLLGSIGLFVLSSLISGCVWQAWQLILARVLQGFGLGAITALCQVVLALVISPRERGRYNGYMGAVMAIANVSGPLIGGLIVATPWLGWRWCMWVNVPFSLISMVILQRFLKVPSRPARKPKIDFWGAALITLAVSTGLAWLSLVNRSFSLHSWSSYAMLGSSIIALLVFIWIESRVPEPIIPLWMFTQRMPLLAIISSIAVGALMNAPGLFLTQYFQVAKELNPAIAGLCLSPALMGSVIFSTCFGQLVSRIGRWKRFVIIGYLMMSVGVLMVCTTTSKTSLTWIFLGIFLMGGGLGACMQNLVLAVQNGVDLKDMGTATATVTFCRSVGGTIGVQIAGFVFTWEVERLISAGMAKAHLTGSGISTSNLDFENMNPQLAGIIRTAYGDALGTIFWPLAAITLLGLLVTFFMRSTVLKGEQEISLTNTAVNERERELVRRALAKDKIARDLEELLEKKDKQTDTDSEE